VNPAKLALTLPGAQDRPGYEPRDPNEPHPTPFGDNPPVEWALTVPDRLDSDSNPHIDDEGRVALIAWEYDRCHNGRPNGEECWTPDPSPTANRMFQQGSTIFRTDTGGIELPTGVLCISGGHAPDDADVWEAQQHYGDPERAGSFGRIAEMVRVAAGKWRPAQEGERPHAAWYLGGLIPGITNGRVERLRRGVLSGDWRWVPELDRLDALGPCVVNRGGLVHGLEQAAGMDADTAEDIFWEIIEGQYNVTRDEAGRVVSAQAAIKRYRREAHIMDINVPSNMSREDAERILASGAGVTACGSSCSGKCGSKKDGVSADGSDEPTLAERLDRLENAVSRNTGDLVRFQAERAAVS